MHVLHTQTRTLTHTQVLAFALAFALALALAFALRLSAECTQTHACMPLPIHTIVYLSLSFTLLRLLRLFVAHTCRGRILRDETQGWCCRTRTSIAESLPYTEGTQRLPGYSAVRAAIPLLHLSSPTFQAGVQSCSWPFFVCVSHHYYPVITFAATRRRRGSLANRLGLTGR
ncbi:hypothetical protein BCV70DRAFT_3314 [Testicularia cyperi]|uniref:Uncharacterized protein n=1 Tax=Testicularia cyperi TaxID=1882483 RepID=A0A317XWC6_9BASI|nr:hypothetical protein BCV70DRAFT_3314 [Testicularia cyperi]